MAHGSSKKVVYAALAGNLAIAATKLAAALWTGSSAMLSEAIHSAVDTGNQGLLLFGMHRAGRPPDRGHPFGHGMELYFWSFVVALLIFALGGVASAYQGWAKLTRPEPMHDAWLNFAVLAAAMVFEGLSFRVAWREFHAAHIGEPFLAAIRASKNPGIFAVLLEDSAALVGLAIAAAGLGLAVWLDRPVFDGVASLAIGALLLVTALFLANETRSLLTGESASRRVLGAVRRILERDLRVRMVDEILSMHLGPDEVLLALTLDFDDRLSGQEIEQATAELSRQISAAVPIVGRVFVRPNLRPDTAGRIRAPDAA
jgi:cation diffusion facilitator family transporter